MFCVYVTLCGVKLLSTCLSEEKHCIFAFSCLVQGRALSLLLTLRSAHSFVLCPYRVEVSHSDPCLPSLDIFVPQLYPPFCHFKAKYFKLFAIRHIYHSSVLVFLISSWILPKMCMSSFKLGASAAVHTVPKKRPGQRRALKSGFVISFALWTDSPPSTFERLLSFPSSFCVWSEDVQRERTLLNVLILHLICLNIGYALGEFTSEGHTNTSYLSRLMFSISVCK